MKTNFFQIIAHLKSTGSWTIHISPSTNDKLVVSVLLSDPVSNKEGIVLTPMIFNETAKVLDEIMFTKLMEPVAQANDLWQNVNEFSKSMENAKKQLEAKAKSKSEPGTSLKAENSVQKKQQYEDAIKKVAELNGLCRYDEALALLPICADYPEKKGELDKLKAELEAKKKQLSLL